MIFSPDVLAPFSQTWLGSYRLPARLAEQGRRAEVEIIRHHPTVSLIDVEDLIARLTPGVRSGEPGPGADAGAGDGGRPCWCC